VACGVGDGLLSFKEYEDQGAMVLNRWQTLEHKFQLATFLFALVPTMAALALQLITFALAARGLGVHQFGQYTVLVAIGSVAVELVGLGGADLLVCAVAVNRSKFSAYFGNLLAWAAASLPLVVLGAGWLALGPMRVEFDMLHVAMALGAEICFSRSFGSLELLMVAHQHNHRAAWLRLGGACVRLLLALLVFVIWGERSLSVWIEAVFVQSVLVSMCLIWLARRMYGHPVWGWRWGELGRGMTFAMYQTSRSMQSNMDRMILSRYADAAALGVYGAATRVVQLGLFPVHVVTRMLYPQFFVHGEAGVAAVRRFAWTTAAPALAAVGVFSGISVAVAGLLAPIVLGAEYAKAVETTRQLAWALPFIALQFPAADALTASGRQWIRTAMATISTLCFGFLLVVGAHVGGSRGVTGAFVLGHLMFAAALWIAVWRCTDAPALDS
jgi:O-antigen/teichoic acid export membrane protein